MNKKALWIIGLGLVSSLSAQAGGCRFQIDAASLQVGWTAFKTTQKLAVKGSFPQASLQPVLDAGARMEKSLPDFLRGLQAEVSVVGGESIQTGNPGRDLTLFQHFFQHVVGKGIRGRIERAQGTDLAGELDLRLTLNGRDRVVPMKYTRGGDGALLAKGGLDVLDFGAQKAFDDLHTTCLALHQGPDGVSKTWSEVGLEISAQVTGGCGP